MSMSLLGTSPSHEPTARELASLRPLWLLLVLLGLISVVVGMIALGSAFATTLLSVTFLGVLLLVAGAAEVVHAIMVRNLKGFAVHLLTAALYLIVGLFMVENTLKAVGILTIMIAVSFLVGGVFRVIVALSLRFPAWPWVLLHGVVDLVLGGMIYSGWPDSKEWVIGLFVGIDLVVHGWSWVILGLVVRSATTPPPPHTGPGVVV